MHVEQLGCISARSTNPSWLDPKFWRFTRYKANQVLCWFLLLLSDSAGFGTTHFGHLFPMTEIGSCNDAMPEAQPDTLGWPYLFDSSICAVSLSLCVRKEHVSIYIVELHLSIYLPTYLSIYRSIYLSRPTMHISKARYLEVHVCIYIYKKLKTIVYIYIYIHMWIYTYI